MVNQRRLGCNVALLGASIYGLVIGDVNGKPAGMAGLIIYAVSAGFVIIDECLSNRNRHLRTIASHVERIKMLTAEDLLTYEICSSVASFDPTVCLLVLVPSIVDNVMWFLSDDWAYITPWAHIADCALFVYVGVTGPKYILFGSAIAYLILITRNAQDNERWQYTALLEAIAVFCIGSCFGGKDLKDYGIPIGG